MVTPQSSPQAHDHDHLKKDDFCTLAYLETLTVTPVMNPRLLLMLLVFKLADSKTPITLLVLAPWPNPREGSGWDAAIDLFPASRVAVKEINNREDVLKDYELSVIEAGHDSCGSTVHTVGVLSVTDNIIYPVRDYSSNVLAVMGLFCSTSTSVLSPLVGREDGLEMIQFSTANSPFFHRLDNKFPHLWRFQEPASVYASMTIHLIKQYEWTNIAIISNQANVFFNGIGTALEEEVVKLGKRIILRGHLGDEEFDDQILDDLVEVQARVVFIPADRVEITRLLCKAHSRGMSFPKYLWIIPDKTKRFLLGHDKLPDQCDESELLKVLDHAVLASYSLIPETNIHIETSGSDYETFKQRFYDEVDSVQQDYYELLARNGMPNATGDIEHGAFLYDEIWTFARTLDIALPKLEANGVSLEDYKFGRPRNFTKIFEESLRNVNFRGVTGQIQFNEYHEVRTPIHVYQILNMTDIIINRAAVFNDNYNETVHIGLELDDFDDMIPVRNETILVPIPLTVVMGLSTALLFIFITVVFFLLLVYRKEKEVKAVSFNVSCLMFVGCYFIVAGLLLITIENSFFVEGLETRTVLCNIQYALFLNGTMLIFYTLCLKLLRLYRIFQNKRLTQHLGLFYSNTSIIIQCIVLVAIPDVFLVIIFGVYPITAGQEVETDFTYLQTVNKHFPYCSVSLEGGIFIVSLVFFMGIVMLLSVYLASKVTRISNRDFRNKRTVNSLALSIFATYVLLILINELLLTVGPSVLYKNVTTFIAHFSVVLFCQMLLFVPNLYRVVRRGPPSFMSAMQSMSIVY